MRLKAFIIFVFFFPLLAGAQSERVPVSTKSKSVFDHYVALFLATDPSKEISTKKLTGFVEKLESKRSSFKKESEFLRYTFNQTHRKFLKQYKAYCTFTQLLDNGTYNCLTGTALYALVLNHFQIDFTIVETNYHIFLLAQTKDGTILLETTDPLNGFVDKTNLVEKRISAYKQNELKQLQGGAVLYTYNFTLFNAVGLDQMVGLLYYNLAVDAYNHHALQLSITYLDQATLRYQSPRIEELSKIILLTLQQSELEASVKKSYLLKVLAIQTKKLSASADSDY